jgi:hypothetical protein
MHRAARGVRWHLDGQLYRGVTWEKEEGSTGDGMRGGKKREGGTNVASPQKPLLLPCSRHSALVMTHTDHPVPGPGSLERAQTEQGQAALPCPPSPPPSPQPAPACPPPHCWPPPLLYGAAQHHQSNSVRHIDSDCKLLNKIFKSRTSRVLGIQPSTSSQPLPCPAAHKPRRNLR